MNCDDAGVFTNVEDCEPLIHSFAAERKQYVLLKRSNVSLQQIAFKHAGGNYMM